MYLSDTACTLLFDCSNTAEEQVRENVHIAMDLSDAILALSDAVCTW